MTAFNWQRVRASPLKFIYICAIFGFHCSLLSFYRLCALPRHHPTNYVTAVKSLLLRIFFRYHYQFIYSAPADAIAASRKIDGDGWWAYEFAASPHQRLHDYDAVILYFHGGGYAIGEPLQYAVTYRRWRTRAAQRGKSLAVVALRYPLSVEQPFPAQRDAGLSAYQYLVAQEHVKPERIVIAGDSAGGHLAASLLIHLTRHPEVPRPGATILISPWLDLTLSKTAQSPFALVDFVYGDGTSTGTIGMARLLAGKENDVHSPDISPALSTDLQGVPAHLCSYGDAEVYHEDAKMWISTCQASNVDVTVYRGRGAVHTFMLGGLTADTQLELEADSVLMNYISQQVWEK